jgi:hypothetical protein
VICASLVVDNRGGVTEFERSDTSLLSLLVSKKKLHIYRFDLTDDAVAALYKFKGIEGSPDTT